MDRWRDSAHKNVNVKVVTGEERDQRIGIALQNAQKRQGHGDTRAAVQGLLDDAGAASVYQVASVIRRVSARQNEYLSIAQEERANTLIRHHSTVGLADRLVEHGLVERIRGEGDRRQVRIRLTTQGENAIMRLSTTHRARFGTLARCW